MEHDIELELVTEAYLTKRVYAPRVPFSQNFKIRKEGLCVRLGLGTLRETCNLIMARKNIFNILIFKIFVSIYFYLLNF